MNATAGYRPPRITSYNVCYTKLLRARRRLSLEQLKDSVARDLEALLNTRVVFDEVSVKAFPFAARSVAGFGLADFAALSLANVYDRQRICASIEGAISAHEPRLREVRVALELHKKTVNALYFSINAVLFVRPAQEPRNNFV